MHYRIFLDGADSFGVPARVTLTCLCTVLLALALVQSGPGIRNEPEFAVIQGLELILTPALASSGYILEILNNFDLLNITSIKGVIIEIQCRMLGAMRGEEGGRGGVGVFCL